MVNLRNINPMVRAVGTMGTVAAVVGGITFAGLTSNTVALSPNTLTSATAHLQIGLTNTGDCADASDGPQTGMDFKLVPGTPSDNFLFCLKNTGDVPLDLTTAIPQAALVGSPIPPADVTLNMTCDDSGSSTGTLDQYTGGTALGTLDAGDTTDCQATVELAPSFSGPGTTVNSFDIDFVGTQPSNV